MTAGGFAATQAKAEGDGRCAEKSAFGTDEGFLG
jgi:hypothetical protein